jgi:hypothetical protein
MSFERYDNGGNNKFPLTNYGSSDVQELAQYGASIGCDNQDTYKIELVVQAGEAVAATEYGSSIVSVLPTGYIVEEVKVDASATFAGGASNLLEVGIAKKADGTGADADALFTGVPTVGTTATGTLVSPADEVLTEDYFITVGTTDATAGKAKVVVTLRSAIVDID